MNDWFDAESLVSRAHDAYEAGRWEEAESALREALALNPYKAEWHFNLGLTLEAAGRFGEASAAFESAHELEPRDAQSALAVGVNLLRSSQAAAALPWLEKAGTLDPESSAPLVHRIEAYTDLEDHEQAEVMFYLAQQMNPPDAGAYAAMADSLLDRGLHDKAVWCLREAARLDPGIAGVHARLAEAYAATGRLERARQLYLRELRRDPGDVDTLLDLGDLLVQMNRLSEAGEKYRRVLEMEPDHTSAHFALAELAERTGSTKEAWAQYDVVRRLDPEFPGVRRRLARLALARADGVADAGSLLGEELGAWRLDRPSFRDADLVELGELLLDARRREDAAEVLKVAAEAQPENSRVLHNLAVALLEMGDTAAGVETCRRVLKADARFVPAMHNIAVAAVRTQQWRRARYWVRQALEVDPDDAFLRRLLFKLRLHTLAEWTGDGAARAWSAVRMAIFRRR